MKGTRTRTENFLLAHDMIDLRDPKAIQIEDQDRGSTKVFYVHVDGATILRIQYSRNIEIEFLGFPEENDKELADAYNKGVEAGKKMRLSNL